jgi:hypothetical protein
MSENNDLNVSVNGTVNVGLEDFEDKGNDDTLTTNAIFQIFSQSNVVIILWFLAVYFVVYILLGIFRGTDSIKPSLSRWIDIVSLLCLLAYLATTFFGKSEEDKSKMISDLYQGFERYANNPISLISVGFFILTLYIVIYILELPMDSVGKPITISIIENGAWLFFVIILIATFLRYIAGISLTGLMDDIGNYLQSRADAGSKPSGGNTAASGNTSAKTVVFDEVFNIGNNMYTYDDAQSVCKSLGARLATYDDIESAYNKGGEWCNYGWSEGQAAYFPTQKNTWNNLQKSESTKHSCGRPGINGGFIDNPNVRFGVNCYGKKPQPKPSDLASMGEKPIPKSPEDILLDNKVQFWKMNGHKLFQINGYNNSKWSMY